MDLKWPQLWHGSQLQLRFSPWSGNSHMLQVWPFKKENEDGAIVEVRLQKILQAEARRWDLFYDMREPMEGFKQSVVKI